MSKLAKEWERKQAYFETQGSKVVLRPQQPFKNRLQRAVNRLENQSQVIEGTMNRLNDRDRLLFSKVVDAFSTHDPKRANVYANELAEIRKTASFMMNAKSTLDSLALRLGTMHQLGDAAVILDPAIKALKSVKSGIENILPGTDRELGLIADLLNEIMTESGPMQGINPNLEVVNQGAEDILKEAAMVAEQKIKVSLPKPPASKDLFEQPEDENKIDN